MEINFTLWSLEGVLGKIPFNRSANGHVDINFFDSAVPYYIKRFFRISILFEESLPFEACCTIRSPNHILTVVIIMKKEYEDALRAWLAGDSTTLNSCCKRRELYCHEVCHLVAIIRAFPSNRSSSAREDFIEKIRQKFAESLDNAANFTAAHFVSVEANGESPSIFDKEHFRYANDSLNYFGLYQELMLDYDRMLDCAKKICARTNWESNPFDDIIRETFASNQFFQIFPEKLTELLRILAKEMKLPKTP